MAYPEPILPLVGKDAEKFRKQFDEFRVSKEQKARIDSLREKIRSPIKTTV